MPDKVARQRANFQFSQYLKATPPTRKSVAPLQGNNPSTPSRNAPFSPASSMTLMGILSQVHPADARPNITHLNSSTTNSTSNSSITGSSSSTGVSVVEVAVLGAAAALAASLAGGALVLYCCYRPTENNPLGARGEHPEPGAPPYRENALPRQPTPPPYGEDDPPRDGTPPPPYRLETEV